MQFIDGGEHRRLRPGGDGMIARGARPPKVGPRRRAGGDVLLEASPELSTIEFRFKKQFAAVAGRRARHPINSHVVRRQFLVYPSPLGRSSYRAGDHWEYLLSDPTEANGFALLAAGAGAWAISTSRPQQPPRRSAAVPDVLVLPWNSNCSPTSA